MIDFIPPWFAIAAGAIALGWWLVIEYRHALPDPNPDELTSLDIYELTGVYPHG